MAGASLDADIAAAGPDLRGLLAVPTEAEHIVAGRRGDLQVYPGRKPPF